MSGPQSDLRIRPIEPADMPRVREITRLSWQRQGGDYFLQLTYGRLGGKEWFDWFWPDVEQVLIGRPETSWVSEVDGQVAGFVTGLIGEDLQTATVGYNAVDPAFRGRRLGGRQIDFLMDRFRSTGLPFSDVIVTLNEGHAAAQHLYASRGFDSVVHVEFRWARTENVPQAIPGTPGYSVRPIIEDDWRWACPMLEETLGPWHRDGRVQARYGQRGETSWCERLREGMQPGLDSGRTLGLVFSDSIGPAGLTLTDLHVEKGIGSIVVLATRDDEDAARKSLLCRTNRALRERGVPLVQSMAWVDPENPEARSIGAGLLRGMGFFDLTVLSDYRFQRLT